jgi:two-component system catabolic regulation response regulator CreB
MLVLVVEDDPDYGELIAHVLQRDGHDVVRADSCRGAIRFAERKTPDLAVVDVVLPDGTGFDLCERLVRLDPRTRILFLSSLESSADKVEGLSRGADDYLTKPFHPSELVARVRAVLRRSDRSEPRPAGAAEKLSLCGLEVDITNQLAAFRGSPLNCTPLEVDILAQLVRYPGQPLSHSYLTEQIWGYKNVSDATLLKGHVSSIRRKIREAGGSEDMVRTVHGVGYSFTPV